MLGASASLHLIRLATAIQQYLPCCKNLTPSTFVFTFESFPHSLSHYVLQARWTEPGSLPRESMPLPKVYYDHIYN